MSSIDDWNFPQPERCHNCGNALHEHWRGKPCYTDLRSKSVNANFNGVYFDSLMESMKLKNRKSIDAQRSVDAYKKHVEDDDGLSLATSIATGIALSGLSDSSSVDTGSSWGGFDGGDSGGGGASSNW